ncbi:MAG: hypothetical protein PHT43_06260, partial [Anaerolineaceae bacterium]|nr:hypothetical protein [Anaerolineaceae bacterium]
AVSLVRHTNPETVEHHFLEAGENLVIDIEIGDDVEEVTLIIASTTLVTREKATYQINIK